MERLRITSKEIYTYYFKELNISGGCTNRKALERKTGVEYNKLRNLFGSKHEFYFEDKDVVIIRVMTDNITKGQQSLKRRGKGGMNRFREYIVKKDYY